MMSGKIVRLSRQKEVRGALECMSEMVFLENLGIEGNAFQGGNRQVCLFSSEARDWVNEQQIPGLCFKNFTENVLIGKLPMDTLQSGDRLSIGDVLLQITEKKPCFDDCELRSRNISCKLSANAFFAIVIKGGVVKLEDEVFTVSM